MQHQIVVQRGDAGEGVVARGPGILEQAQKLPGAILERTRRSETHCAHFVVQALDRGNFCLDALDHIVGQRHLEVFRWETLAGEKEVARHHRRYQSGLRFFWDGAPYSAHEA
jgi:hypothetical protein